MKNPFKRIGQAIKDVALGVLSAIIAQSQPK